MKKRKKLISAVIDEDLKDWFFWHQLSGSGNGKSLSSFINDCLENLSSSVYKLERGSK